MTIPEMIDTLNLENGSNYKIEQLEKFKHSGNSQVLKKVLKMTYDKVAYTYGITMKNINYKPEANYAGDYAEESITLEEALNYLEKNFVTRYFTGNQAIYELTDTLQRLSAENAKILEKVIDRDLRINMGRSGINKVFKNLITKEPYMRCSLYNEKTSKKINYPALIQLKADGLFQAIKVDNGKVTFTARSGEERDFPELEKMFISYPDGVYIGELLVEGYSNRSEANGLINSDSPPHDKIYTQLWDYVSLDEYSRPKDKLNKTIYRDRFNKLEEIVNGVDGTGKVQVIENHEINNVKEALEIVSKWMNKGFEGGILKDYNNIFIDHTSPTQLKLKLSISAEMRVTGFIEGKKGTKREKTFGSLVFENDEGTIKGSCSGFTDKQLKEINNNRNKWIGKVIEVEFNDITKGRDNDYWALSHPRFIEARDKNETDTLEKVKELKEMAMNL